MVLLSPASFSETHAIFGTTVGLGFVGVRPVWSLGLSLCLTILKFWKRFYISGLPWAPQAIHPGMTVASSEFVCVLNWFIEAGGKLAGLERQLAGRLSYFKSFQVLWNTPSGEVFPCLFSSPLLHVPRSLVWLLPFLHRERPVFCLLPCTPHSPDGGSLWTGTLPGIFSTVSAVIHGNFKLQEPGLWCIR